MQHSENHCCKLHDGKILLSTEVTQLYLHIKLWSLVARQLRKFKVSARTILYKKKQAGFTENTNVDLKHACNSLQASYNNYRIVVKDGKEQRVAFISSLAMES